MTTDTINIDARPVVVAELPARVELTSDGEPFLQFQGWRRARAVMQRLANLDIQVALIRPKKRRSPAANRYLWGVVYRTILKDLQELALEQGDTAVFDRTEDLHNAMKWKFLRRVRVLPGGEEIEVVWSSTALSTQEFSAFIEAITAWAGSYGIHIPTVAEWERTMGEITAA